MPAHDHLPGSNRIGGRKIKFEFGQQGRARTPAVSDRTWPEGTGVNRLSSGLTCRVTKYLSPETICSEKQFVPKQNLPVSRKRGNFVDTGPLFPVNPEITL
jgi:hypothetical protein